MPLWLSELLSDQLLLPHATCLLWRPDLLWMHAASDALIGLSYISIPVGLAIFLYKRRDVRFRSVFAMFAVFIFACGTTHLLGIWTLWQPQWGVAGVVKAFTAAVSVATAMMLFMLLPKALAMPGPAAWEELNRKLGNELDERRRAEAEALDLNRGLEYRVLERTEQLERANRQLAESNRSLRASEAKIRGILETAVDGIITIDEQGRVLTVNPAAERLFGYAADEIVGNNVNMLMPEPYHSAHDGYLARYRETGERRIIGIGREVRGRRKDGTVFPLDLAVGEVNVEGGRFFTGIVRDVTERKRGESDLREAKQTLESIIEALPVAVFSLDRQGFVALWNHTAETMLGWSKDEVEGKPLPAGLFEGDPSRAIERARAGERFAGVEVRCGRKHGTPIDASFSSAPLHADKDELAGVICVVEDVTQRKSLATQLYQAQKMEAVGQLTGGIAHDFNNLLGVAIGNIDLLEEELQQEGQGVELAEAALASLLKGADLTRSLLAFSRRQPLHPTRIRIDELLASSIRMLRRTLGEHIEVSFRSEGTPWPVVVDPAQLEAALTNLAINARDAMPNGGKLSVSLRNTTLDDDYAAHETEVKPGEYVLIEISDTGQGMAPEVLARAFEPFFTTKATGKGTGLGLSMVYGFIKQSGGHIKIYSEVGLGTTVRLYLPRVRDEEASRPAEAEEPVVGGDETILLVEDDPDVRKVVARQLESLGYRLIEAPHAPAALDILRSGAEVDMVFTDVVMPHGMTGFDLARQATRLRPGLKVLFTSGFPSTSFAAPPELAGGVELLSKPYRKQDLARAVRAFLDSRRGTDAGQAAGR